MWDFEDSSNMSFVEMDADEIARLAHECIKRIEEHRARDWENAIAIRRLDYQKSWFRRLFQIEVPSDADIRKKIESDRFASLLTGCYAWGSLQTAEKLLRASRHAKKVSVSTRDLESIGA
jgi:hypothetical protein